jgi:hypothetical protein
MGEEPTNIVLVRLEEFRKEILKEFGTIKTDLYQKIDKLDHKVGNVALTLVGVEKDIRRLTNSLGTLGAAVDEIDARLAVIETRNGQPRA